MVLMDLTALRGSIEAPVPWLDEGFRSTTHWLEHQRRRELGLGRVDQELPRDDLGRIRLNVRPEGDFDRPRPRETCSQQGGAQLVEEASGDDSQATTTCQDVEDKQETPSDIRRCSKCGEVHKGFGDTCSDCRKAGPHGSQRQCGICSHFFCGFGTACPDCLPTDAAERTCSSAPGMRHARSRQSITSLSSTAAPTMATSSLAPTAATLSMASSATPAALREPPRRASVASSCASEPAVSKQCSRCTGSYSGFGEICGGCRKFGTRGSASQCRRCGHYFSGFGELCDDCGGGGRLPAAKEEEDHDDL